MIILSLETKSCMSHLLIKPTFDHFSFIEGEITTCNKFTIDGFIHKDFFEEPPEYEYSYWSDMRDYCFSIIRGKRTPLNFKLIFSLSKEEMESFLKDYSLDYQAHDIQGLYLNFRYDGTKLQCVTGTSMNLFTMDKSLENAWDKYVQKFLGAQNISFEIL